MLQLRKFYKSIIGLTLIGIFLGLSTGINQNADAIQAGIGHRNNKTVPITQNNNTVNGSNSAILYYNWSGYAVTSSAKYNEVKTSYIQPSVTCPVKNAWTLFWVGFDGFNNGTVEQAGTQAICSTVGGKPTYSAWWEMYPTNNIQFMPITINPGDSITDTVIYNSNGYYTLTVFDSTNGQSSSHKALCGTGLVCSRASAEWVVERPTVNGTYASLANWKSMQLSNSTASNTLYYGTPVLKPVSAFNNTPINMVNYPYTGRYLATVGALNTYGNGFTDTWLNSQ